MEENLNTVTSRTAGTKYGLMLGLVLIVCFLIIAIADLDAGGSLKWLNYPFYALFVFLAHKFYKDQNMQMSYSAGVGVGFWVALISSLSLNVFIFIYINVIDPNYMDGVKQMEIQRLYEKGINEQGVEQAKKMFDVMLRPATFLGIGLVFGIIGVMITSLIVSIFTQRSRPESAF